MDTCKTLTPDRPACLNIPLIRGSDYVVKLRNFIDGEGNPIDLAAYVIRMYIRRGGSMFSPVSTKVPGNGISVDGNGMDIIFKPDDAVFDRGYGVLHYSMTFTKDGITKQWLHGRITIKNS